MCCVVMIWHFKSSNLYMLGVLGQCLGCYECSVAGGRKKFFVEEKVPFTTRTFA